MERVGVVGPDLDCWRAGLQVLDVAILCKKQKKKGVDEGFACGRFDA